MGLLDFAKKSAKNYIIKILKGKILKIIILVAAIILVIASFWYAIGHGTISTVSKVVRQGDINTNVTIDEENRNYKIDETLVERVNEALDKMAINRASIELTDDLLLKFYEAEIITSFPDLRQRDKIGTKVPDGEIQGRIQFKRFDEEKEDFILLEYKKYDDFKKEIAKLGVDLDAKTSLNTESTTNTTNTSKTNNVITDKEDAEKAYNNLKQYFTLDKENNLIIPTMSSTETTTTYNKWAQEEGEKDDYNYTYNVDIKKINYQLETQKYSMPIEYLLSMLMVSENGKFCEAISDLVEESKIVIEIHDELTKTNIEESFDYESSFYLNKIEYYTYETGGSIEQDPDTGEVTIIEPTTENYTSNVSGTYFKHRHMDNLYDSYRTIETEDKQNQIQLCIVEAKTWLLETTATYNRTETTTDSSETIGLNYTEDKDNELKDTTDDNLDDYKTVSDKHKLLKLLKDNDIPSGAKLDTKQSGSTTIKEKRDEDDETTIINTKTESVKYNKVSSQVTPKEEKFLSLLRVDPKNLDENKNKVFNKADISKNTELIKYTNEKGVKSSPENNLLSAEQVLFSYLSSFEQSQSFEEIMRYLLYIYTGQSYGVTNLDFSIYEAGDFISAGGIITGVFGCTIPREEFIKAVENYNGSEAYKAHMVPYAGDFYDICKSNNINPIFVFAHSCIETTYGSSTPGNNYFGMAVYNGQSSGRNYSTVADSIRDYCNWVIKNAKGENATANNARAQELAPYASELNGTADTNIYVLFCRYAQLDQVHDVPGHETYIGNPRYFMKRIGETCSHARGTATTLEEHATYAVYTTDLKIKVAKNIFGDYASILSGGTVLQEAILAHQYVEQNGYSYAQVGLTIPDGILRGKTIDCSSFVSWVLYRAGFTSEFAGHQKVASTFLANPWGWETISSISEAVAGDILVYSGHVEIYAGEVTSNNKARVYNCGGNKSVQNPAPSTSGYYTSQILKIIRAPR